MVEAFFNGKEMPAQARVLLGGIQKAGVPVKTNHSKIPKRKALNQSAPIVAVAGTASNNGKPQQPGR